MSLEPSSALETIEFPLYKNDGVVALKITDKQLHSINKVLDKISIGEYRLEINPCLCGSRDPGQDIVISEKDRYGLPIPSVLCQMCGLIRSQYVFDAKSNDEFYRQDYRDIYTGDTGSLDDFFEDQQNKGAWYHKLYLNKVGQIVGAERKTVLDIGCGAGGTLVPFSRAGCACIGVDYNRDYLSYGQAQGLDLRHGDYASIIDDNSVDIILLFDVMEHFLHPVEEMQKIIAKVKCGGHLIIRVPGILDIDEQYEYPLLYFQNAHTYSYYGYFLETFFKSLGLEMVYGDEFSTCVLRKPLDFAKRNVKFIYAENMRRYAELIIHYLKKIHCSFNLKKLRDSSGK